jgi:DNA-binding beta-propeller fold protein YncE
MNNIDFQIRNPAAESAGPDLFLGKSNTLQLIFTNDLGIAQLKPGDQFTVMLPGSLLQALDPSQMSSPDWHLVSRTLSMTEALTLEFVITPAHDIDFTQPTTVSFTNVQCRQSGNDDIRTRYLVQGRALDGTSERLFVLNPPGQLLDLNDVLSFEGFINADQQQVRSGVVYISPDDLAPAIANTISVNVKFAGERLVDSWPAELPPRFEFSFSTGQAADSLTDNLRHGDAGFKPLTSAWGISAVVGPGESTQWMAPPPPDTARNSPTWIVTPAPANSTLLSRERPNLDVVFDHVVTILPAGNATLYIQWSNVPGYRDGLKALDLKKQSARPRVITFSGAGGQAIETIAVGAAVDLEWTTFGAHEVVLSWTAAGKMYSQPLPAFGDVAPQLLYDGKAAVSISPPVNEFGVFIAARSKAGDSGPAAASVVVYRIPRIRNFIATLGWDDLGAYLDFEWLVEGADSGEISGIGVTSIDVAAGSHRQRFTGDVPFLLAYTLTVHGANGQQDTAALRGEIVLEEKVQLRSMSTSYPMSIVITADGKRAYVAGNGSDTAQCIYSFDARHPLGVADQIDTRAAFPTLYPKRIAISSDGARACILLTDIWHQSAADSVCICDVAALGDLVAYKDNVVSLGGSGFKDITVTPDGRVHVTRPNPDGGFMSFDGTAAPGAGAGGLVWTPVQLASDPEMSIFGASEQQLWVRFAPDGVSGLVSNGGNLVGYFNGGAYTPANPCVISCGSGDHVNVYSAVFTRDGKNALIVVEWGVYLVDLEHPPSSLPMPSVPGPPWPARCNRGVGGGWFGALLPNGENAVVLDSGYYDTSMVPSACWCFDIGDPAGPKSIASGDSGNPGCLTLSPDGTKAFAGMLHLDTGLSYVAVYSFRFGRNDGSVEATGVSNADLAGVVD